MSHDNHCGGVERLRILIVDDSDLMRRTLLRALEDYPVVSAASSHEALSILHASSVCHVVLSDFQMPGHDGVWLLTEVRSRFPDVTRFLMTGCPREDIPSGAAHVAERIFHKPHFVSELRAVLRDIERLQGKIS